MQHNDKKMKIAENSRGSKTVHLKAILKLNNLMASELSARTHNTLSTVLVSQQFHPQSRNQRSALLKEEYSPLQIS